MLLRKHVCAHSLGGLRARWQTWQKCVQKESWTEPISVLDNNLPWSPVRVILLSEGRTLNDLRTSQESSPLKVPPVSRLPHWGPSSQSIMWTSEEQTQLKQLLKYKLYSVIRWKM